MVTVLCFLQNPLQGLIEATRVLKPHGRLIIGIIDPESPLGRSYEANKEKSRFYRQAKFHRVRQVLEWLEELGYPNPRICQTIFQDLPAITGPEPVREGYGDGAFVVIAGQKPALSPHLSSLSTFMAIYLPKSRARKPFLGLPAPADRGGGRWRPRVYLRRYPSLPPQSPLPPSLPEQAAGPVRSIHRSGSRL